MARYTPDSLLNSLKGKIWLATSALAFFICTFGLVSYLIVSFVINDPFYAVFVPFLFLAFTVMFFGWWLSTEVVSPIEKVSLLARSLERSASTSLPKTSGSTETDELLATLHRNSLQMQKLVGLMDEVAAGNTNVALTPLQNSDRLTAAFQKLLAKVTDSIDAKHKLEQLQNAVAGISEEIGRVRKFNLDAEITIDARETKEIAETLKFLINHLNNVVALIRNDSGHTQTSAMEIRKTIQTLIQQDEVKIQEMNQAVLKLREIPNSVQRISENFAGAVQSANQSIEKARSGTEFAQQNLGAVALVRKQLQEAMSRIGRINERAQEMGQIAKTVADLAHRTNTIALNAAIQAGELGEQGRGFSVVAEEIERISGRAENTNKQISSLSKSMTADIVEVERSLKSTVTEAANLSKFAVETGNSLSELEKHITQILSLQDQLTADSSEQSDETEQAFQVFVGSIAETEMSVECLRQSEKSVSVLTATLSNLLLAVDQFKLLPPVSEPGFRLDDIGGLPKTFETGSPS
ncbi:MAG: methyl-accepting chemotaxis protein [Acidobacteria bacterium]|nr:methyl-accepting chemotaxis protein [Acidobacteriota bacterium]